jgi:hypothetical protein
MRAEAKAQQNAEIDKASDPKVRFSATSNVHPGILFKERYIRFGTFKLIYNRFWGENLIF